VLKNIDKGKILPENLKGDGKSIRNYYVQKAKKEIEIILIGYLRTIFDKDGSEDLELRLKKLNVTKSQ
jgi:hypothetical protein